MSIDFGKLGGNSTDTVLHPRDLFSVLPSKADRYKYPRDVQTEVWNQWFDRRTVRDLTIKMNTGSGKTTVGLLILKSCLNEGVRPAVYIAPNPQLAQQVLSEARDLGIDATDQPRSPRFQSGREILVTTIRTVVNGRSVFGVGDEGIKIQIGSLIVDDAHACLDASEEQFALKIPGTSDAFKKLLDLFYPDLEQQSLSGALDLKGGDASKNMLVPFWAWQKKQSEVHTILRAIPKDDNFQFAWLLLKNHITLCQCVFSGHEVEMTPRCLPINMIRSFQSAERRVFMSATVSDDSVLVTHFDANAAFIKKPIVPASAGDIGDRMILIPQELNPSLDDAQLKVYFQELAQKRNVVVLVPSEHRATFWSDVATETLRAKNLLDGVARLKHGHVGLVVLVNKYDGIDLPGEACRVLVVDGLPDVRSRIDRIEQSVLNGSDELVRRSIQRVEQGMGRGIRSNDDWCAVFLIGRSLVPQLYARNAKAHFTAATHAQLALSEQLSKMMDKPDITEIDGVVQRFLVREKSWVQASKGAILNARYAEEAKVSPIATNQRAAFNAAANNDFRTAANAMQAAVNAEKDDRVKGWLMQQVAEYTQASDPVEAQHILRKAVRLNNQVLHPLEGVEYVRLPSVTEAQASIALAYLREAFPTPTAFLVDMYGHLDSLVFRPDTAPAFERALAMLARVIGFASQLPERDFRRGPDILWNLGRQKFLVIEAKNGATTEFINKHDCNQLNGSMLWFNEKYGESCSAVPVMFHPSNIPETAATMHPDARVITAQGLPQLREALNGFALAVAHLPKFGAEDTVAQLLAHYKLTADGLIQQYATKPRMKG